MEGSFDNMFSIMPMAQRFLLTPGETYEGTITVVNPADATNDFTYQATVTPYSVLGAEYAADLTTMSNRSQIVDWIKIENPTGTVSPNKFEKIKFTITVPEDAAGGGQYATIAVSSGAQTTEGSGVNISNIFEMASVIYGYVEGDISHEGEILQNSIPGYATTTPVKTQISVTNHGNVHEDAKITIKATNFFTGEVLLPEEGESGAVNEIIMPGTERYITEEIDNLPALGVVHVEQTVYYLGMSSVESVNVVICPVWFLVLMIAAAGGIIGGVARLIVKHRRNKAKKNAV